MKTSIYIGMLILVILGGLSSCARLFGGMSKDKAAKTLDRYLKKHTQQALGFTNLTRFWNEGNMNPNMFSVEIFDEQTPEIRFGLHFDAKLMNEKDSLKQGGFQTQSIQEQYNEVEANFRIKQRMIAALKKQGIALDFDYYSAQLQFKNTPTPEFLKETLTALIARMNTNKSDLLSSNYFEFNLQTPPYSTAVLQAKTTSEENEDWKLTSLSLNTQAEDYKLIEKSIEQETTHYLKQLDHQYQMHPASKVYVNTDTFKEAVWIQFLSDASEADDTLVKRSMAPVTAVIFQYFNPETHHIIRTELTPIAHPDSFEAYWEGIETQLPFPTHW